MTSGPSIKSAARGVEDFSAQCDGHLRSLHRLFRRC